MASERDIPEYLDNFHHLKPEYRAGLTKQSERDIAAAGRRRGRWQLAKAVEGQADADAILAWYDAQTDQRLALVRLTAPGYEGWINHARREMAR